MHRVWGRLLGVALALASPVAADMLEVRLGTGDLLAEWPMTDGQELCLTWAHSVTGGKVIDCFANDAGRLTLARSYLHDFAAGLGEVPGRGMIRAADGGGYWIDAISEPLPENALTLRIGSASVDHLLSLGGKRLALSQIAPGATAYLTLLTETSR